MPAQQKDVLRPPRLSDRMKYMITGLVLIFLLLIAAIVVLFVMNQRMNRADAYIKEGNQHYASLDYDQAEICYKEAISLKETDSDAYLSLAKTYLAKGDWESAVAILEYGYKKTEDVSIQTELARVRATMSEDDEAEEADRRSSLIVSPMDVQTGRNADTYHITDGTAYAVPGTVVQANPAVPYVDDGILEQFRPTETTTEASAAPEENSSDGREASSGDSDSHSNQNASQTEPSVTEPPVNTTTEPAAVSTETRASVTTAPKTETETSVTTDVTTTVPFYVLTNEEGVSRTIDEGELEMWYRYWKHMVSSATTIATTTGTDNGSVTTSVTTKATTSGTVSTGHGLSETTTTETTATTIGTPMIDPAAYTEFMTWLQLFIFDIFSE